jgi:hypothetical protein
MKSAWRGFGVDGVRLDADVSKDDDADHADDDGERAGDVEFRDRV